MKYILTLFLLLSITIFSGCNNHDSTKMTVNSDQADLNADRHRMPDGTLMKGHEHPMITITSAEQFLTEMIPHHQEAVDTSKILLESTTSKDLKLFLEKVIQVQTAEIEQMKTWLADKYKTPYDPKNAKYMPMMGDLTKVQGTLQEVAYINGMIVHHQGAIKMSEQLLNLEELDAELKVFANTIITAQSQEIDQLVNILSEL